jgi:predicted RNA-binding protein with PUA domain
MNSNKKIISFVMMLLVAAPFIIFSVYTIKQKIIQVQMQQALEQGMLQTITLNKADVHWEEEGEEIIIDGALFDVKSYSIIKDKIVVTGLYDKQETVLKNKVEKLQHQKNNSENNNDNLVLKFMFTVALLPKQTSLHFFSTKSDTKFVSYSDAIVFQTCNIITPPPIF